MNQLIKEQLNKLLDLKIESIATGNMDALKQTESAISLAKEYNLKDYLTKALVNKSKLLFFQKNLDLSCQIANEAFTLANELKDHYLLALSYNNLGAIHSNQCLWNEAINYYLLALEYIQKTKDELLLCQISRNLGIVYLRTDNLAKGNFYLQQALNIATGHNNEEIMATIYSWLSSMEAHLGRKENSLKYSLKTSSLFFKIKNYLGYAMGLNTSAVSYLEIGEFEEAFNCLNKAEKIALENKYYPLLSDIYHNYALCHYQLSNYDTAIKYYKKSLKFRKFDSNFEHLSNTLNNLGEVYCDLKNSELAHKYYLKAYKIRVKYNLKLLTIDSCIHLAKLFLLQNKINSALKYIKKAEILNAIQNNLHVNMQISNFYNRLYYNQNNYENALLYLENYYELKQQKAEHENLAKILIHKTQFEMDMLQNDYENRLESERINTVVTYSIKTNEQLSLPYENLQNNIEQLRLSLLNDSSFDKYFNKIGLALLKIDQLTKSFLSNTIVRFKSYLNLTKMIDFNIKDE